ncbi:MAG: hypothetical protein DSY89_06575 [Deltaproteobacteria bacterium]|nr:MAG: hypothetical protein DSY89_06575 [Deltaproteobacteria bacterium]
MIGPVSNTEITISGGNFESQGDLSQWNLWSDSGLPERQIAHSQSSVFLPRSITLLAFTSFNPHIVSRYWRL